MELIKVTLKPIMISFDVVIYAYCLRRIDFFKIIRIL
jgi:hypothetical protein